jgi:hypothetical protein
MIYKIGGADEIERLLLVGGTDEASTRKIHGVGRNKTFSIVA